MKASIYPPPAPTVCRFCSGTVIYTNNRYIYGRPWGAHPFVYVCTECKASVGVHPQSKRPLGTLADTQLKVLRREAKTAFFSYTESRGMVRKEAYAFLRNKYKLHANDAHFGMMDAEILIQIRSDFLPVELTQTNPCTL